MGKKSAKNGKKRWPPPTLSPGPREESSCENVDLPSDHWNYDPYQADDLDEICRRALARPNT